MLFELVLSVTVVVTVHGVTLNCVPSVPTDQASVKCTCTNPTKNGVQWRSSSGLITACSGTVDNSCFPISSGYTSSVTVDEFYFDINSYSYANCATYICKDATTGEEASVTTSIADFNGGSPPSEREPGEGNDGNIEITTDCIFREADIVVNWYIVDQDVEKFTPADEFKTPTTCSDASKTCNGDNAVTLKIGFKTKNENNNKCGKIRVEVYHSADPSTKLQWTTVYRYCTEKRCPSICEILAILCGLFGCVGLFEKSVIFVAIMKEWLSKNVLLYLDVAGIGLFITSIGFGAAVVGNDDCHDDCLPWVINLALAFTVISSLGIVVDIIIAILILVGVIHRND